MRDWNRLFKTTDKSGVYSINITADIERVRQAAIASGLEIFQVNLADVGDKEGFLKATAEMMKFPTYFGMNWDALEECLADLSWLPAAGYIIFITGTRKFIESSPADMKIARQVFKSAAAYWKEKKVPFYTVLSRSVP